MYPVSEEYTKLMNDDGAELAVYVEVDFGDGAVILSGDQIEYIDFNERVNDNSRILTFGCSCAHSITIKLREPPELQYKGLKCKPRTGIMLPNGDIEWVPLGVFWVDSARTNDDYRTVLVTAFDKMYKLNQPFTQPASEVEGEYKVSFENYVKAFETAASVTVVRPEGGFPEYYITNQIEEGEYNCRDIAGHLAGCLGKNATFNRDGELEFAFYTKTDVLAFDDLQYMNGFEKLSDNALKINFLVTGKDGEIELENDGTDPGRIEWTEDVKNLPMFTFVFNDDDYTCSIALTKGYETSTDKLNIPALVLANNRIYTVTSVASSGFANSAASIITIPSSVTSIGGYGFRDCKFEEVTIPEHLSSMGGGAFYQCTNLKTLHWNATNLSAAGTGQFHAFNGCSSLENVIFAENVTTIPAYIAQGTPVKTVTIHPSVTSVGAGAFCDCKQLTHVYWNAKSVSSAGTTQYSAFTGCSALEHVTFADDVEVIPGNFMDGIPIKTLTIPATVKSIGGLTIRNCTQLETIYWNAIACTSVGTTFYSALSGLSALTSFIIGDSVQSLPKNLFGSGATALLSVDIPASVTSIASNSFSSCTNLVDITVHKATDSIKGSPWGASKATVSWVG